ncbi:hypothetical protein LJC42_06680 [Eubacteriales bacterium OttesenSCG-928-K08]|nr:hypothetical protein [Eubacteriales bacterium OttesenSCG-928-K08]
MEDQLTIMSHIHAGDKQAFAALYSRYNKTVFRMAMYELGDEALAVEVVKEVFREIYQLIRMNGPYMGDFYAWLDSLTAKHIQMRRIKPDAYYYGRNQREYSPAEAREIETKVDRRMAASAPLSDEEERPYRGLGSVIGLSMMACSLIWVLVGLLGSLEVLPQWDLGYTWFNDVLFPLF